jgi:PPOX class probable F420-dependent enzyme
MSTTPTFESVTGQRTVLLTTHRRDGSEVPTPVNIAVEGDHAYVRSWRSAGKTKRILRDPNVDLAPSTYRGKPKGPAMHVHARLIEGDEARHAAELIDHKSRILQGVMVPLYHKLRHLETVHFELTAA